MNTSEQAARRVRAAIADAVGYPKLAEDYERAVEHFDEANRRGIAACRAALASSVTWRTD